MQERIVDETSQHVSGQSPLESNKRDNSVPDDISTKLQRDALKDVFQNWNTWKTPPPHFVVHYSGSSPHSSNRG